MYVNYNAADLPYVRIWLDEVTSSVCVSVRHLSYGWHPMCRLPGVALLVSFIEEASGGLTDRDVEASRQLAEAVRSASKGL